MNAAWGDEEAMLAHAVREFINREVTSSCRNVQLTNGSRDQWVSLMKRTGVYAMAVPQVYGGQAVSMTCYVEVIRELSRGWTSLVDELHGHTLVARLLTLFGTEEQKCRYLPRLATGDLMARMALRENDGEFRMLDAVASGPTSGGELLIRLSRSTTGAARRLGLENAKWLTVSRHSPDRGSVPDWQILGGEPGSGPAQIMKSREITLIHRAASALGVATAAIDDALAEAQQRAGFGRPIWKDRLLASYRADTLTKLAAAQEFTRYVAERYDSGASCDVEAGIAEILAKEASMTAICEAAQILGRDSTECGIKRGSIATEEHAITNNRCSRGTRGMRQFVWSAAPPVPGLVHR